MQNVLSSIVAFMLLLSIVSCSEGPQTGKGIIRIFANDVPATFEYLQSLELTIKEISVIQASGKKVVVMESGKSVDLLRLRNGRTESFAGLNIPGGVYEQINLKVSEAKIKMKDGRKFVYPLSEVVTVRPDIMVTMGMVSDVLLDIDLFRSFRPMIDNNQITGFFVKPSIKAISKTAAGSISGEITGLSDMAIDSAIVTISQNGQIFARALTNNKGFFKIIGLPAGSYHVTVEKAGFSSITFESVLIKANEEVNTNLILPPSRIWHA